jgi:hypothetical protein
MKAQWKLVIFTLASFAAAEGVSINPSQSTPAQNPSQTAPSQNPTQAVPPMNPSGTLPVNPPMNPPSAPADVIAPAAPMTPAPNQPPTLPTDRQVTTQITRSILQGPNAANGLPSLGVTGISITGLRITRQNGWWTLLGQVHSEREKAEAGARAAAIVGEQNVVNEISVR